RRRIDRVARGAPLSGRTGGSRMSDWGGAPTPSTPAVVSGPGANSARTDGGVMNPNSPSYGKVADVQSLPHAAPLAGTAGAPVGRAGAPAPPSFVGLGEPSQDQLPVSAGVPLGAGPGAEALGLPQDATEERGADARSLGP